MLSYVGVGASVKLDSDKKFYGEYIFCEPVFYERYTTVYHYRQYNTSGDNYIYTRAELTKMIQDKQDELKRLDIDLRSARLTYQQDLLVGETGEVTAAVDGIVTGLKDVTKSQVGDEIMTIKGEESFTVNLYVNEMDLSDVNIGDMVSITAYESGTFTTGTITGIETEPLENYQSWGVNPNSSYYPVTATVDDPDVSLRIGEWCDAQIMSSSQTDMSDKLYLQNMYIRSDERGSYCLVADNGILKKQYVSTGMNLWGSFTEIRSGITMEDYVAFPYGKGVSEGNPVNTREEPQYW